VRRLVSEKGVDVTLISGTGPGSRVTKGDVLLYLEQTTAEKPEQLPTVSESGVAEAAPIAEVAGELTSRKPMTPIRQRIAARLLEAKQSTAMLTTFNDIDMSRVIAMRTQYKESFLKKHDVSLGFMSFFIKACVEALKEFPEINAFVDGKEFVYHHYYHIGVAIGTGRGDLEGGTFTITNGGVFGSLLSTPILNTPQSAILGMHRIEKRPVVVDDEIVVRPMMYVALSYDHRIVDGREAVTFLKCIKEFVENPERIIMEI
jgi:2-oxoglutarate dehydrogenase E2 component (dihydrolipoamide succinyltransferase)